MPTQISQVLKAFMKQLEKNKNNCNTYVMGDKIKKLFLIITVLCVLFERVPYLLQILTEILTDEMI